MGLVWEEAPEAPTKSQPRNGEGLYDEMVDAYAAATAMPNGRIRQALIDGLNNRYRSKQYRDMIKNMISKNQIHPDVVRDMTDELRTYRYTQRTPHSKAWRFDWL